jgi:hypothetical protein
MFLGYVARPAVTVLLMVLRSWVLPLSTVQTEIGRYERCHYHLLERAQKDKTKLRCNYRFDADCVAYALRFRLERY